MGSARVRYLDSPSGWHQAAAIVRICGRHALHSPGCPLAAAICCICSGDMFSIMELTCSHGSA